MSGTTSLARADPRADRGYRWLEALYGQPDSGEDPVLVLLRACRYAQLQGRAGCRGLDQVRSVTLRPSSAKPGCPRLRRSRDFRSTLLAMRSLAPPERPKSRCTTLHPLAPHCTSVSASQTRFRDARAPCCIPLHPPSICRGEWWRLALRSRCGCGACGFAGGVERVRPSGELVSAPDGRRAGSQAAPVPRARAGALKPGTRGPEPRRTTQTSRGVPAMPALTWKP